MCLPQCHLLIQQENPAHHPRCLRLIFQQSTTLHPVVNSYLTASTIQKSLVFAKLRAVVGYLRKAILLANASVC
eukprot:scaffold11749_cov118-Skeletonema_dohrnii-CCMP3373.AAC.1